MNHMKTYELKKEFANYYLKRKDAITFRYTVFDGFDTKQEAEKAVARLGHSPSYYVYILFKKMIYAVSMETLQKQVVIGKNDIYYRYEDVVNMITHDEIGTFPFQITNPRIGSDWMDACARDLEEIEGKPLTVVGERRLAGMNRFTRNSTILLGIAFFDTMVPVYQLNAFDVYFSYPPSRFKLWEEGVRAYNPFTNEKDYAEEQPYTIDDFQVEHIN